jgi:hypothetical protein
MTDHYRSNIFIKIVEIGKIDNSKMQIHDGSFSWLGTGTSIKTGKVKLVLLVHTN